jgi:hypothetical protein
LVPGFPLIHADHQWLARLVLSREVPMSCLGLYIEQPYARRRGRPQLRVPLGPQLLEKLERGAQELNWSRLRLEAFDRRRKRQASRAYHSQLPPLTARWRGRLLPLPVARCKSHLFPWRISLNEALRGGESIAWIFSNIAGRKALSSS